MLPSPEWFLSLLALGAVGLAEADRVGSVLCDYYLVRWVTGLDRMIQA